MLSSHYVVKQWTPNRRYKAHDLQGPFKNKKGEKKENERSVFQLSSLGLHCSSHTLSPTPNVKNLKIGPHNKIWSSI